MPRSRKAQPVPQGPIAFHVDAAFNTETHAPLVLIRQGDNPSWSFAPQDARAFARLILDKAAEAEAIFAQKQTLAHVEASINQTIARVMQQTRSAGPNADQGWTAPAPQRKQEAS